MYRHSRNEIGHPKFKVKKRKIESMEKERKKYIYFSTNFITYMYVQEAYDFNLKISQFEEIVTFFLLIFMCHILVSWTVKIYSEYLLLRELLIFNKKNCNIISSVA